MEKINIEEEIEKLKMKKLDFLTEEEVVEILIRSREKSFLKKRKALKDGMRLGLNDVDDLFEAFATVQVAPEKKDFFEASIKRVEKRLEKTGDFIADCDWPSQVLLDSYNDGLMRLCYVKKVHGLDISDAQAFIEHHGGLESVAPKQLVKQGKK